MSRRGSQAGFLAASLLAAYLLVLQTVLGGLAMGAHAGMQVGLGPSGEVICLNTPLDEGGRKDPAGHLPDCCTSGCRIVATTALPPPELAALPAPPARLALALAAPRSGSAPAGAGHLPHNARAPPSA